MTELDVDVKHMSGPQAHLLRRVRAAAGAWYGLGGKEYASARVLAEFGLVEFESNRYAPVPACYCESSRREHRAACGQRMGYARVRSRAP